MEGDIVEKWDDISENGVISVKNRVISVKNRVISVKNGVISRDYL